MLILKQVASYPTGSLDFLVKLQKEEQKRQTSMQASNLIDQGGFSRVRLSIIIVGAGLGGLAAAIALARKGHKITVVEQAPALAEVCLLDRCAVVLELTHCFRSVPVSKSHQTQLGCSCNGGCSHF